MDPRLLSALASQVAAQSSAAEVDRTLEGAVDCGVELTEDPKLAGAPRYESVVNAGPLSGGVILSGAKERAVVGSCGSRGGGAAIVEPMLVQAVLDCDAEGFAKTLRSTGMTGVEDSQLGVVGGAGVPEPVGHGGGAKLRV